VSKKILVVALAAVAVVLGAGAAYAGHGHPGPKGHTHCGPGDVQYGGCQAEVLPASCTVLNRGSGWSMEFLSVPDTPYTGFVPIPGDNYLQGHGTAVFRPNGTFAAGCSGTGFYRGFGANTSSRGESCAVLRGGTDITFKGTKLYTGISFVRVGAPYVGDSGALYVHFVAGCAGRLEKILPS
jgi:hypothetical protein